MGLVAESLDMLADASVYGLSLWAIGSAVTRKKSVAKFSAIIQFILAGILVLVTQSKYPDLIIGGIVFIIVVRGAIRMMKLGK